MLKRFQVLLPDWLEEYIKFNVELYDLSFSEILRTQVCISTLVAITTFYPEYQPDITMEDIFLPSLNFPEDKFAKEKVHQMVSKISFEARKAIEYRMSQKSKDEKK